MNLTFAATRGAGFQPMPAAQDKKERS